MPTYSEVTAEINRLLKAGDVQAASDYAAKASADAKAEEDAAAGIPPTPPPPREPGAILLDFMELVASRFGHHHEFAALIDELKRGIELESQPPKEPAPPQS